MKILVEGNTIRLTGEHNKSIEIYYSEKDNYFSFSVCQNGMIIGCLPTVTFYKDHTIVLNNLPQGKSFVE